MTKKAIWIAKQLDLDPDDVYDILAGNITKPEHTVNDVRKSSDSYELEMASHNDKIRRFLVDKPN